MKKNIFFTCLVMAVLPIVLIGCGKKGDPMPPHGENYDYPGSYPSDKVD